MVMAKRSSLTSKRRSLPKVKNAFTEVPDKSDGNDNSNLHQEGEEVSQVVDSEKINEDLDFDRFSDYSDDGHTDHNSMLQTLMKNSKYGKNEEGKFQWAAKRTGVGKEVVATAMTKDSRSKKLRLSQLLKASKNAQAKKKMRNFEDKKILEAPLKKPLAQKAARRANFEEVKEEISKYDPIVKEIRTADQMVFPRNDSKVKFNIAAQFETSKARTEEPKRDGVAKKKVSSLEKEITEQLMFSEENVEFDNRPLTENELAILQSKSIEEARELHHEIQRRRLLTSFQEAKFRRLRKIKSKKYHRILKKEKLKKTIEEFDQIVDAGAEGAEEKLAELDRLRALERASLKHHITGKWSKYNKLRAKYDEGARDELNKQMAMNAELMKKRSLAVLDEFGNAVDDIDSDEEDDRPPYQATQEIPGEEIVIPNNYNPWISSTKTNRSKKQKVVVARSAAESATPSANDDNTVENFFAKRVRERLEKAVEAEHKEALREDALDEKNIVESVDFGAPVEGQKNQTRKRASKQITTTIEPVEESEDEEDQEEEEEVQPEGPRNVNLQLDSLMVDDVAKAAAKKRKKKGDTDGHDSDSDADGMGDFNFHNADMQKYLREAFIDDDVVADFLKEKKAKEKEESGEVVKSVYMPGWGNWAGSGIAESRRKRARQVKKITRKEKRTDEKITNAIILKGVDAIGEKFKIAFKPATVANVSTFESSLSKPIGSSWNPQSVFRSMTAPKVITKVGAIIEPMESSVVKEGVKGSSLKPRLPTKRKPLR